MLIRLVVPLRLSDQELEYGDEAIHGEEAYALWGDGVKFEKSRQFGLEMIYTKTSARV